MGRVVSQGSSAWITHFLPEEEQRNIEQNEQTMNALKRSEYKLENLKMDLSLYSAAPRARLSHLSIESDRALPAK